VRSGLEHAPYLTALFRFCVGDTPDEYRKLSLN
jgi:AraC-like DNA-binding protein